VPSHLDFLLALDDHITANHLECVRQPHELYGVAESAGLNAFRGDQSAARWTGQLVHLGYVVWGLRAAADRRPIPTGAMWTPDDLTRFSDYYLTPTGREEADRIRRQQRESLADAAMGAALPRLQRRWMTDVQRRAVSEPLTNLRLALDADRRSAVIGSAKDLVEAACKVTIERAGPPAPTGESLPTLFKLAAEATRKDKMESDVGHRLAAVVAQLAALRNAAGAGHGRALQPELSESGARLAATAAAGIAVYLLDRA
jgi:hypothetical protein